MRWESNPNLVTIKSRVPDRQATHPYLILLVGVIGLEPIRVSPVDFWCLIQVLPLCDRYLSSSKSTVSAYSTTAPYWIIVSITNYYISPVCELLVHILNNLPSAFFQVLPDFHRLVFNLPIQPRTDSISLSNVYTRYFTNRFQYR